jgi:hypothetical protein
LEVLDSRELTKDELGVEIAARLAGHLPNRNRARWNKLDPFTQGATKEGETLVRFALSLVALQGLFCIAPRRRDVTTFVRMDQWLGKRLEAIEPARARTELVRRYLACYGPSTPAHFAEWAGISPAQGRRLWRLVEGDVIAVELSGKQAWLHKEDVPRYQTPQAAKGIRFLPPHDPYLQQRDRLTLLPDKKRHPRLWRHVGNPGALLIDGQLVATWRPQKTGKRLRLTVETLARIQKKAHSDIEAEAEALAAFRECDSVEVQYADGR